MQDIKDVVRDRYARIAENGASAACCSTDCCSGGSAVGGYDAAELAGAPAGSNLGLGCGNPVPLADPRPGEIVLDLGSGPGLDCFLAAERVGPAGRVIGVDMTAAMLTRARGLARERADEDGPTNVEFRLGEIEHLPVADGSVDVVMSNCVINLSPDKPAVFREAYRVLKPGGRVAVCDVVALRPLPPEIRNDPSKYAACIAGAVTAGELEQALADAGFETIRIRTLGAFDEQLVSSTIEAVKP